MANGANRLFDVIKQTGESTNGISSQVVSLTIKSVNPLILMRDDRLEIPAEFCILHKSLDINNFRINDIVTAIVLNNGQQYFILYNDTAEEQGANYNELSNKPKINGVELKGNKTSDDLLIVSKSELQQVVAEMVDNINNKVTKSGDIMTGELNMQGNPIGFGNGGNIFFKEDGFGDKFRILPNFSGAGSDNKLIIQSTNGDAGTDPQNWKDLVYIHADTGLIELAGEIKFNNINDYALIRKSRQINGVYYNANFGIGVNQSARIEFQDANENVLGNLEVRANGIYNGKSGRKLLESGENLNANNILFNNNGYAPRFFHLGWGSTITATTEIGGIGLIFCSNQVIYTFWIAGGNHDQLNVNTIWGNSNYCNVTMPDNAHLKVSTKNGGSMTCDILFLKTP